MLTVERLSTTIAFNGTLALLLPVRGQAFGAPVIGVTHP